jgi:hypothetical protein
MKTPLTLSVPIPVNHSISSVDKSTQPCFQQRASRAFSRYTYPQSRTSSRHISFTRLNLFFINVIMYGFEFGAWSDDVLVDLLNGLQLND